MYDGTWVWLIQCKAGMESVTAESVLEDLVKAARKKYDGSIKGMLGAVVTGMKNGKPVLISRIIRNL